MLHAGIYTIHGSYGIVFTEAVAISPRRFGFLIAQQITRCHASLLVAKDILLAGSFCHLQAMIEVGTLYEQNDAIVLLIVEFNLGFIHLPCCLLFFEKVHLYMDSLSTKQQ